MKEQYVSFEVAKLLKEKGFDWKVFHFYDGDGHLMHREGDCYFLYNWNYPTNDEYGSQYCSAPTQQMACRWLREEKDIDIIPFHEKLPNDCYWCRIERNLLTAHQQEPIYKSYEDAVEAALEYTLTNLI